MINYKTLAATLRSETGLFLESLAHIYTISPRICSFLVVAIMISGIFPSVFIKTTANIIQILSEHNASESSAFIWNFSIWGIAILAQNVVGPIILYLQSILADKLTFNIHSKLIKKANSFESVEAFDDEEFHNRLELIRSQASHKPLNMIVTVVGLFKELIIITSCLFLVCQVLAWKAGLMLICAITNAAIFVKIQDLVWQDSLSRSKKSRFLNYLSTLSINTKYIKEIRFFGYAKHIENLYNQHSEELYTESQKTRRKVISKALSPLVITMLITIFLTFSITDQIASGLLSIGAIAILVQSILQLQMAVNSFGEQSGWVKGHLLFFAKYFEFLKTKYVDTKGVKKAELNHLISIEFQSVDFSYSSKLALQGINFRINKGDKIAIVGANGAGKSTFIKLLCGLYLPTKGKIFINGEDINNIELSQWRIQISPVFQDFCTYDFTVKENITCCGNDFERLINALKKAEVGYIESMLYDKVGKTFGGVELSVGQWQKIALARALYNNGEIFVLDEPTASLDPLSEYAIFEKFDEISKGKTVIFVTHRLNSIRMADKVMFMEEGEIIDYGTHLELMHRCPKYKEMFDKQSQSYISLAVGSEK